MSKPITTVRADLHKIKMLMAIVGEEQKATAINKAIDHVLNCHASVSSELSKYGHFVDIQKTQEILMGNGIQLSRKTLRRWCKAGKLKAIKSGSRNSTWFVAITSIDAYLSGASIKPTVTREE